jgi:hypothetical protein
MIHDNIKSLVNKYISRQRIVYEAVVDLRPDKLVVADKTVGDLEAAMVAEKYKDVPGIGFWLKHGKWKYYMHGGGCRLTNVDTGEPLEWDAPDTEVFDKHWFINWHKWTVQGTLDGENITDDMIAEALLNLEKEGYITRVESTNGSKFRLTNRELQQGS